MKAVDRALAYELFQQYNKTEALTKHALAVEAVMRHFAAIYGEDADTWGIVGLLHDLDYEQYPDEHCKMSAKILEENGYEDAFIHAVVCHGYGLCSDVEPVERMEKVLYTTDELTGLITAAALMRPNKSVMDLEYKSLLKKFKSPSFAAGVNREVISKGCGMLGEDFQYVCVETIAAMRSVADALGLAGS